MIGVVQAFVVFRGFPRGAYVAATAAAVATIGCKGSAAVLRVGLRDTVAAARAQLPRHMGKGLSLILEHQIDASYTASAAYCPRR